MSACRKCLSQTTEMSGLNDSCRWTEFLNLFQMPEGFESHCLNRYEKSRIRRHVAVTLITMFMPKVPDYTVTFISSVSAAVPDTQNDVLDLVLHLFQTNEDRQANRCFNSTRIFRIPPTQTRHMCKRAKTKHIHKSCCILRYCRH